ncbi:hypothetical protein P9112_013385 [Eukaryota sp. TZLM1-RC]
MDVNEINEWLTDRKKDYREYTAQQAIKNNKLLVNTEYGCFSFKSTTNFSNKFFDQKDELIKILDFFQNNKEWYEKKGIPHTLGILLYGPPTTGKTSIIKSIMNYLKRDAHIVKLTKYSNPYINETLHNSRCIVVFEDIDCLDGITTNRNGEIPKRNEKELTEYKNQNTNKKEITLQEILNILDGLDEGSDRLIIMTTNHPEKLDPAITRPGRIDIKLEMPNASLKSLQDIINHFYNSNIIVTNKELDKKFSPAEIVNMCRTNTLDELCLKLDL